MPPPGPPAGYTPTFHMPIIGTPPPAYNTIPVATTFQVARVAHEGLEVELLNPSYNRLYAVVGGLIRFIPTGAVLPTSGSELSPGSGSLVIQTWVADIRALRMQLPAGIPPMRSVLYLNVNPASVRTALQSAVNALPDEVLEGVWTSTTSSASGHAELVDNYLDQLLLGQAAVFIAGGTVVGEAERRRFTLRFIDGAGDDLSPVPHIRSFPEFAGSDWEGHPLIDAVASIPIPVNFYLRFEVWNASTHTYVPLPAGVKVDLMDEDIFHDDRLATERTDSDGRVHFGFSSLGELADLDPDDDETDIYFLVHTNGRTHAGHTLPSQWSTLGWRATDGTPGHIEDFKGTQLGDSSNPVVFRIGLDFHLRLDYRNDDTGSDEPAPAGVMVRIETDTRIPIIQLRTNADGEVHGMIFNVEAGEDLYARIIFEIQDTTIQLPSSHVAVSAGQSRADDWRTMEMGPDRKHWPNIDETSIGTQSRPEIIRCTAENRNVNLYFLKILREISTFLYHITNHNWTGVRDLTMFRSSISGTAYSWPLGSVNIAPRRYWNRKTIIHELAHQVMWKESNYSSLGIAVEFLFGQLHGVHDADMLSNPEHALIEGWAEFIAAIFSHSGTTPPYPFVSNPTDSVAEYRYPVGNPPYRIPVGDLGPPPNGRGDEVEGAFANAMWTIFKHHVVTTGVSSTPHVPESTNGDITTGAPWVQNSSVITRFWNMVWHPLKDIASLANPATYNFRAAMETRNPSKWHELLAVFQRFNLAMERPFIDRISPNHGAAAGGQSITIEGFSFAAGTTTVRIGGAAATGIRIESSRRITAITPPGMVGAADVVVENSVLHGTAAIVTAPGEYTYE